MSDFLVVKESDDGMWYDEGETCIGLEQARALARGFSLPRGYEAVIYKLEYVEAVERVRVEPKDAPRGEASKD